MFSKYLSLRNSIVVHFILFHAFYQFPTTARTYRSSIFWLSYRNTIKPTRQFYHASH